MCACPQPAAQQWESVLCCPLGACVQHAGLNPMGAGDPPRAGCPRANLRRTVADLIHAGLSVVGAAALRAGELCHALPLFAALCCSGRLPDGLLACDRAGAAQRVWACLSLPLGTKG